MKGGSKLIKKCSDLDIRIHTKFVLIHKKGKNNIQRSAPKKYRRICKFLKVVVVVVVRFEEASLSRQLETYRY